LFKIFRIPLNSGMCVPMPEYMTPGAAAMDFYSANIEPMTINPGQTVLIPLGIKVAIAPGYKLTLKPRSGLALKGITLTNSPGTVDSDYRGEVGVIIHNAGRKKFVVEPFMRICQGEIEKAPQRKFTEVSSEEDLGKTLRGKGGYSSTGLY
jgi:dUTP pyrophosphatase